MPLAVGQCDGAWLPERPTGEGMASGLAAGDAGQVTDDGLLPAVCQRRLVTQVGGCVCQLRNNCKCGNQYNFRAGDCQLRLGRALSQDKVF